MDTTRDETPTSEKLCLALQDPEALLQLLQLNEEMLLKDSSRRSDAEGKECLRWRYGAVQLISRVLSGCLESELDA